MKESYGAVRDIAFLRYLKNCFGVLRIIYVEKHAEDGVYFIIQSNSQTMVIKFSSDTIFILYDDVDGGHQEVERGFVDWQMKDYLIRKITKAVEFQQASGIY